MWHTATLNQEAVAKCLLHGLVFQRGVPITLRSDNAPEFVEGIVRELNAYLNIDHIQTGGYNPRGNSICERVNQTIGAMLRKCTDEEYANIMNYLPAMQFAINTTFNSSLNCTPFEAGHGLPARTIAKARADACRLQFSTEGSMNEDDMEDISKRFDESSIKAIIELSSRFSKFAQSQPEWTKRMTSKKLNQAGKPKQGKNYSTNDRVWFYKPPSQLEAERTGRKAKRTSHYHGPAIITKAIGTTAVEFTYKGKTFQRERGMLIPFKDNELLDKTFDPTKLATASVTKMHTKSLKPAEGEYVIMKDGLSNDWYCAQIYRVLGDRIEVHWFTTNTAPLKNYSTASENDRMTNLKGSSFLRTWCLDYGRGQATTKPPKPTRRLKDVYSGRIPISELHQHLLIRNVGISAQGKLDPTTLQLAVKLKIPHHLGAGGEDDFENKEAFWRHAKQTTHKRKRN